MKKTSQSRRHFLAKSSVLATGLTLGGHALSSAPFNTGRVPGANDRVRVGFIGVGNRGTQLMNWFMENDDVEVAALCDVYQPYADRDINAVSERYKAIGKVPDLSQQFDKKVKRYKDFRKMLEQKDIDAVCIATPDHWHAIQMIAAVDAGKDVYVEKPLAITIKEGREMVNAQKRTGQVVQVGLNRRGSSVYRKLHEEIRNGKIGKVTSGRAMRVSNMAPNGIGKMQPEEPPANFDWDMWLGPRPYRPYQYNIAPYYFRWWSEFSSQMGNWGVHYMDVIRWMTDETAPRYISAHGGKFAVNDDRDIPDTMEVFFEFDSGRIVQFSIHEASGGHGIQGGEIELLGEKGNITASQNGYKVSPSRPGQFQTWKQLLEPEEQNVKSGTAFGDLGIRENTSANLVRNFLDCVKSRETPVCTLEDGHRSTSFAHLANIALAMRQRLEWDAEKEQFVNNPEANKMLHYQYRKPWKLG